MSAHNDNDGDSAVMTPPSNLALTDSPFADVDLADVNRAWALDCALHGLPAPDDRTEDRRYRRLIDDLTRGDGFAAADQLADIADAPAACVVALLPCYVAATLAVEVFNEIDCSLVGGGHLMRRIRHQVRDEFLRLPAQGTVEWIVSATLQDRTAAHVAALMFACKGTVARPWLWSVTPDQGRFTIVGTDAHRHPDARHPRCRSTVRFATIIRQP